MTRKLGTTRASNPFIAQHLISGLARWALAISVLAGTATGCTAGAAGGANAEPGSSKPEESFDVGEKATPDPAHNLLKNMDFESGKQLPWMTSFTPPGEGEANVKDGSLCMTINKGGKDPWDAQLRHREMTIAKNNNYALKFKAWASRPTKGTVKIGMSGPPYAEYFNRNLELGTEPTEFEFNFTMWNDDDPTAELAYHLGGSNLQGEGPIDVCIDDVVLASPGFTPPPPVEVVPPPGIRVNQVGYLPKLDKIATLVSDAKEPQDWQLLDTSGKAVAEGKTKVIGADGSSGDSVHQIDFSKFQTEGSGYTLKAGDASSDKFDIGSGIYAKLKYDAFKYFYLNRSGIELKMPFTGREDLARPAGHPKDIAPCAPDTECKYKLDVTGGWYDAGDYGKYVVNGGISVWTLMNWYERAKFLEGDTDAFADGKANIPESGNKVPDVLDEARWEMRFMLAMQVPEGKPLAGMVHHKMHDEAWSGLALKPHDGKLPRYLRPPSTAATLNLAATAAQAARIWKDIDPAFSKKCLAAAERAWAAAKANPKRFALAADTIGGGPYDDDKLDDEFYWAAAELFITTEKPEYKQALVSNPHDANFTSILQGEGPVSMTWGRVDSLGKISLAVVPNKLGHQKYRNQIAKAADSYVAVVKAEGYAFPFTDTDGKFPWGSNSFVLNNMLIAGLAYDFNPKKADYLNLVGFGMDYLLGRNAMAKSYITGYGDRPLENPHHRFWSYQANVNFPKPPPGAVSGGPNSGLQDPYVKAAGLAGCVAQKCFVDNIEAWSVNEITINWNAPLFWVSAWLDEHSK